MVDTPGTLNVNLSGTTPSVADVMFDPAGNFIPQNVLRVNGAPVSTANPLLGAVPSVFSAAVEGSHILKAAPGTLYSLQANAVETGWVLLFDATAVPGAGQVIPRKAWFYNSETQQTLDRTFSPPLAMVNGALVVFSTTGPFTYTPAAAAQFSADIV